MYNFVFKNSELDLPVKDQNIDVSTKKFFVMQLKQFISTAKIIL